MGLNAANSKDFSSQKHNVLSSSENGFLTDFDLPKSEREAFANYLAGAFGYYKKPYPHRNIELNFIEAFERIVIASDLLKKIDPENDAF